MRDSENTRQVRKPRVAFVIAVPGHGGPAKSLLTVLPHLSRGRSYFLSPPMTDDLKERLSPNDELVSIPRPKRLMLIVAQIRCFTFVASNRRDIDVVFANGLTELLVAFPSTIAFRKPVIVWARSSTLPKAFSLVAPLLRLSRNITWLAVSNSAAKLVETSGACRSAVVVVPNAVDVQLVLASKKPKGDLFRLVYLAGTDRTVKGWRFLPGLIKATSDLPVEWHLYTSPPRTTNEDTWILIESFANVHVHARVTDIREAFSNTDIVVSPSIGEAMPRVVLESMANSVPILASDIQAHRDLVDEYECGRLFDPADPSSFRRELEFLLSDDNLIDQFGNRGHEAVVRCFRPEIVAETLRTYMLSDV